MGNPPKGSVAYKFKLEANKRRRMVASNDKFAKSPRVRRVVGEALKEINGRLDMKTCRANQLLRENSGYVKALKRAEAREQALHDQLHKAQATIQRQNTTIRNLQTQQTNDNQELCRWRMFGAWAWAKARGGALSFLDFHWKRAPFRRRGPDDGWGGGQ